MSISLPHILILSCHLAKFQIILSHGSLHSFSTCHAVPSSRQWNRSFHRSVLWWSHCRRSSRWRKMRHRWRSQQCKRHLHFENQSRGVWQPSERHHRGNVCAGAGELAHPHPQHAEILGLVLVPTGDSDGACWSKFADEQSSWFGTLFDYFRRRDRWKLLEEPQKYEDGKAPGVPGSVRWESCGTKMFQKFLLL